MGSGCEKHEATFTPDSRSAEVKQRKELLTALTLNEAILKLRPLSHSPMTQLN